MDLENRKEDTAAEDVIITIRLSARTDVDLIEYLNEVPNRSGEIKRIVREYLEEYRYI